MSVEQLPILVATVAPGLGAPAWVSWAPIGTLVVATVGVVTLIVGRRDRSQDKREDAESRGIASLQNHVDTRFTDLKDHIDRRFTAIDNRITEKAKDLHTRIEDLDTKLKERVDGLQSFVGDLIGASPRGRQTRRTGDMGVSKTRATRETPAKRGRATLASRAKRGAISTGSPRVSRGGAGSPSAGTSVSSDRQTDYFLDLAGATPRGKYAPLANYLKEQGDGGLTSVSLSFDEIASILGIDSLPASARDYPQWWSNNGTHTQARAWLWAGWSVGDLQRTEGKVTFERRA